MSLLSTIYLFRQQKTSTTMTDDEISLAIGTASVIMEHYLDRQLEYQMYRTWKNGTGDNSILLDEWPITRVYQVSSCVRNLAEIKVNDAANVDWVVLDISSTGLDSTFWYPGGDEVPIDEYHNLTELLDQLDLEKDLDGNKLFDCRLTEDRFGTVPTMYLRPESLQCVKRTYSDIWGLYSELPSKFTLDLDTNRGVYTDFPMSVGISNVFCWYSAGYTLPIDNEDHTGLVDDDYTLPYDLITIINSLANDLWLNTLSTNTTVLGNGMKSESQGKYSYTRNEISEETIAYTTNQILKYENILARYRKLTITRFG